MNINSCTPALSPHCSSGHDTNISRADMNNVLNQFSLDLEQNGSGLGPNGAIYRLIVLNKNKVLAVERVFRNERTVIVGFSSRSFPNPVMARSWAILDSRHEYRPDIPLLKRKLLV